jgi:hypothetical protein
MNYLHLAIRVVLIFNDVDGLLDISQYQITMAVIALGLVSIRPSEAVDGK